MKTLYLRAVPLLIATLLASCGAPSAIPPYPSRMTQLAQSSVPQIFVYLQTLNTSTEKESAPHVLVFPQGASGNVAPLANIGNAKKPFYFLSATTSGEIWASNGNTISLYTASGDYVRSANLPPPHKTNQGEPVSWGGPFAIDKHGQFFLVFGTLVNDPSNGCQFTGNVFIAVYSDKGDGRPPKRTINLGSQCRVTALAAADEGSVFASEVFSDPSGAYRNLQVVKYAPTATGKATPVRTISFNKPGQRTALGQYGIYEMAANAAGDLFVDVNGSLYVSRSDASKQRLLRQAGTITGFALGKRDTVYATINLGEKQQVIKPAIAIYRGASWPAVRTITGPKTKLGGKNIIPLIFNMGAAL